MGNSGAHFEQSTTNAVSPEIIVLASGGIDSSTLLAMYVQLKRPVAGLFIDYGQPAVVQELRAVTRVSQSLNTPLSICHWNGVVCKHPGMIIGRNALLLLAALMEAPRSATTIAIGVHTGTSYKDCTASFIDQMQKLFATYDSAIKIAAPFIEWTKPEIFAFARERMVPIDLTYSCETGGSGPCGTCASCLDREALNACA